MEAATSTLQHSFGPGPRGPSPPYGAQQAQGSHQLDPGSSGASRSEEQQQQQHHKPFFYVQPSQPYLPMQSMQWPVPVPMPVSYNPYYGYPGLGYGMPVMPSYQPNPYTELPGFVVPHTHLHLMDYRRMLNPQYYQTMAYQSRRFRYQHNGQAREMTSSEVQTEPLSATQRTSTSGSSNVETSSGLPVHSTDNTPSVPTSQPLSPAFAVQKGDHSLEPKDMLPSSNKRTPPNGSFVIQTEEVRIECCTTPVGLQLLHSHETSEVSHSFSQDVVQCRSIRQGRVLQDKGLCLPAEESEQVLQARPDILLVGMPSSDEKIPASEETRNQIDSVSVSSDFGSQVAVNGGDQETSSEKDQSVASKNLHFKVVHLPFDPKYLDELRKMESTVWSMEDTMIPSPESLIQNGCTESCDETLAAVAEVPSADALMVREEAPTEEVVPMIEMPPLTEDELDDMVPTVSPGDEMASEPDMCSMMGVPVAEETPMTESTHIAEVAHVPYLLLLDNSPLKVDRNQHRRETNAQDHQDTSFESLPAYLPSTSWLADFDNVYYCSKLPQTPKKQSRPLSSHGLDVPSRRRKLDLEYKEQPTIRKPKERYKPKGKVDRRSLSDHECCVSRNFNENAFGPYVSKKERLCAGCQAKRRICTSASPGLDAQTLKRKAFQQWNDGLLPTCEACKSHTNKRLMRQGSSPDVCGGRRHGHDTEGESSENSSWRTRPKWRAADNLRKLGDLKRPLASKQNLEKCPTAMYPKLREKNCVCNEACRQSGAWERMHHCPHGNTIREMDENCAVPVSLQDKWRNMDQINQTHRWQTEKSWKAAMTNPDTDGSKNEAKSQHLNKHKKSQGTCRKDTRC
ncbi:uncharacterized protein LOC123968723 [Micropterus dolomieu]|uniref:uncharacterized protein LOC123968723 n=1 Tax=Micropterus dolomieu TaxID=147949 RepID=UPI001E8EB2B4|nr:uncharacterized protein LOC123968723 [Micropterus dolomieu]